jgi:hypothetical protein
MHFGKPAKHFWGPGSGALAKALGVRVDARLPSGVAGGQPRGHCLMA